MRPLNLEEFAEELRRKGDYREFEFANDILALVDLEEEVAEPYSELCASVEDYAKAGGYEHADKPAKAVEWLGDRSNLLAEIETQLKAAERTGDVDDEIKEMLGEFETLREILDFAGFEHCEFKEGLEALAERTARAPEETEIVTYDL